MPISTKNVLTFAGYQKAAARTINPNLTSQLNLDHALHLLSGEVGEIHSIFQKNLQGHPISLEELSLEIGDLLWGIAELCTVYGWDMGDIANQNICKLQRRYPNGFETNRSINREESNRENS